LKCPECGDNNPDNNQFCTSCGKPLPKLQGPVNSIPAGARQAPVAAAPKGSGPGLMLVIGGLLVVAIMIVAGLVVILSMLNEDPGISSGESYLPIDTIPSGDYGKSSVSSDYGGDGFKDNPESTSITITATTGIPQPVRGSSIPDDFILGTWNLGSTVMNMQFGADGVATLRDSTSGYSARISWEKIAEGKYRLRSPSGAESPVLIADPLAGMMYFEDYSTVFIREA
jgi:hypothetical protein